MKKISLALVVFSLGSSSLLFAGCSSTPKKDNTPVAAAPATPAPANDTVNTTNSPVYLGSNSSGLGL